MALVPIRTEPLATPELANARAQAIYRSYHPAGYGTELHIEITGDGYVVAGYRYDSCD